jgi:hypothetical protein
MEHNPDLDKGHCQLSLKNAIGIDHVNPKSWEGKVWVGDVNLREQWDKGRKKAEKILQDFYKHEFNFEQEFSNPQYDLLRPRGSYVGVQATPDDARSEQERTTPLQRVETVLEPASVLTESAVGTENSVIQSVEHRKDTEEGTELDKSWYNDCDDDLDDPLGIDIEDFLPDTPWKTLIGMLNQKPFQSHLM